ncbi:TPA: hypothetical protein ACX4DQ_002281 [Enterococcus faecalis]|uniref:hypothetical protein n=1 Tax=Enterococcus faecalis TaxID=1351 RepID=UPI001EE4CBEA|nr:hypothetical protein [Enterococcus faecalis]EHB5081926.1 hypothetical protein [Enterococcus faecalis]EKK5287628.1 hypothetical protein [Enterococcus faecalis]MDK7897376.1 hypothetical protein [Enterococcus faecalis]UKU96296.1 hypothetical protein L5I25_09675 [Enterococcus faecalis]UKU98991.1 hypothetical protein L5I23_09755 [Enterococcus faecalis]
MYEELLVSRRACLGIKDLSTVSLFGDCFELEEIKPLYRYKKVVNHWGVERMYPTNEVIGYSCLVTIIEGDYEGFLLQVKVLDPVVPELQEKTAEQPVFSCHFKGLSCFYVKSENRFPLYLQAENMDLNSSLPETRICPC